MAHVTNIIKAEENARKAFNAARTFCDFGPDLAAFNEAERILAEARHFAVCWAEQRTREDERIGKVYPAPERVAFEAEERGQRDAIINRLVSALVPTRL